MKIDTSIVEDYLAQVPSTNYDNHWVFSEIELGNCVFTEPDNNRIDDVLKCQNQIIETCSDFVFYNNDLVHEIFSNIPEILKKSNILLTVGMPEMYDAMVRNYQGEFYMIFDLINFANYMTDGVDLSRIVRQLLTHELIHVLIFEDYPTENDLSYVEYLNYMSFHEGFAHLLAYGDNIKNYKPNEEAYRIRFDNAKEKLLTALKEESFKLQEKYKQECNSGNYWDKFGAISSKLFLMKNMQNLREIYNDGWENYISKVINFNWD